MTYSEIQQLRRKAEKLINRAMKHAKEGRHELCADFIKQASGVLSFTASEISAGAKYEN